MTTEEQTNVAAFAASRLLAFAGRPDTTPEDTQLALSVKDTLFDVIRGTLDDEGELLPAYMLIRDFAELAPELEEVRDRFAAAFGSELAALGLEIIGIADALKEGLE